MSWLHSGCRANEMLLKGLLQREGEENERLRQHNQGLLDRLLAYESVEGMRAVAMTRGQARSERSDQPAPPRPVVARDRKELIKGVVAGMGGRRDYSGGLGVDPDRIPNSSAGTVKRGYTPEDEKRERAMTSTTEEALSRVSEVVEPEPEPEPEQ